MQRRVSFVVRVMHIRARSHQRVDGGFVAIACGKGQRRVAFSIGAIHACTRLQQRSDHTDAPAPCSPLQRRPIVHKRVGIRARRNQPLSLRDVSAIRSAAQRVMYARHCRPAHTRRHTPCRLATAGRATACAQRSSDGRGRAGVAGECAARPVVPSRPRHGGHTGGGAATKRTPPRQARRVADRRGRRGRGGGPATRGVGAPVPCAIGAARSARNLASPRHNRPAAPAIPE
jgi:hypothetical protein